MVHAVVSLGRCGLLEAPCMAVTFDGGNAMDVEAEKELADLLKECVDRARGDIERSGELLADELMRLIEAGDRRLFHAAIAPFIDWYASKEGLS